MHQTCCSMHNYYSANSAAGVGFNCDVIATSIKYSYFSTI